MNKTSLLKILNDVNQYYSNKITAHGPTARGVDWNSKESQEIRFDQLLKLIDRKKFSLNDLGCGYGYLYEYMKKKNFINFSYYGVDISESMVEVAKMKYGSSQNFTVCSGDSFKNPANYCLASGVFNVKMKYNVKTWEAYILSTLKELNSMSIEGFSFNCLTSYSDKDYMRDDLYYGDPCFYFDYCKKNFSHRVALLHDYNLYEFTILVRKG